MMRLGSTAPSVPPPSRRDAGTVMTMIDNFLDELEGCDPLTGRAKTAVVLALKDGRTEVSDRDWELAGLVMDNIQKLRSAGVGE